MAIDDPSKMTIRDRLKMTIDMYIFLNETLVVWFNIIHTLN